MLLEKIQYKLLPCSFERFKEVEEAVIEIHDDILRVVKVGVTEYAADSDDVLGKWETSKFDQIEIIFRKDIAGVDIIWVPIQKRYKVMISVKGVAYEILLYYKSKTMALDMQDKLVKWKQSHIFTIYLHVLQTKICKIMKQFKLIRGGCGCGGKK